MESVGAISAISVISVVESRKPPLARRLGKGPPFVFFVAIANLR